jgi:hypothetical protein
MYDPKFNITIYDIFKMKVGSLLEKALQKFI